MKKRNVTTYIKLFMQEKLNEYINHKELEVKLRHNITHINKRCIYNKNKNINIPHEEVLYFSNLYNIKDEQRDLSFYSNEQWNNDDFIKNIMELKT
ncbi:hypothetical protein PFDG_04784 [Plasmodium falciparum Dd2]|uniref:Uncharacterized protein n=1 Tax=Plasmodium falciparum (isolate Dd2) TaxID=57267 RepID=A0A0L7M8U2_PLAF4|nr:hypothetical protein PFDG_04784 [Plasmodium falciparum Dd2]